MRRPFSSSPEPGLRGERPPRPGRAASAARRAPGLRIGLAVLAALAGCRPAPAPLPEVRVYATTGDAPAQVLVAAAARAGIARVRLTATPAEAEVLWFGDPAEALADPGLLAPGAAPRPEGVDAGWGDPAGRWAPLCARARVLLVAPHAALPFAPENLRDLADHRLAGRFALASPAGPDATLFAALAALHGDAAVLRFLELLAKNGPRVLKSDDEVRVLVARGEVAVGLAGTEQGAAGALSAAGLQVVYPDQALRGALVATTAVAIARGAEASAPARELTAYMVGPRFERLLVARVPGFMPVREDVPVPEGVRPAGNVVAFPLDWEQVAKARARLLPALRGWSAP